MKKLTLSLFAAVVLLATSADAEVLCRAKKGTAVQLRAAVCTKSEVQINVASLGLIGPKGDQGDQGVAGPVGPRGLTGDALVVLDSTGKPVGPVIDIGCKSTGPGGSRYDRSSVRMVIGGRIVNACVGATGIVADLIILYPSTDCSGDGYVDRAVSKWPKRDDGMFLSLSVGNIAGRKVLYRPDYVLDLQTITVNSVRNPADGICVPVAPAAPYAATGHRIIEDTDLSAMFTPPFIAQQ